MIVVSVLLSLKSGIINCINNSATQCINKTEKENKNLKEKLAETEWAQK